MNLPPSSVKKLMEMSYSPTPTWEQKDIQSPSLGVYPIIQAAH